MTIRNKINAYMDSKRTQRFIDVLPNFIDKYNDAVHRMINLTPFNAEKKKRRVNFQIKRENIILQQRRGSQIIGLEVRSEKYFS